VRATFLEPGKGGGGATERVRGGRISCILKSVRHRVEGRQFALELPGRAPFWARVEKYFEVTCGIKIVPQREGPAHAKEYSTSSRYGVLLP